MSTHNLKPMSEVIEDLKERGYKSDFIFESNSLRTYENDKKYKADDITVVEEYRFEGDSNPSDMAILYAIETASGDKGTLVDSYGPDSSVELEQFLDKAHHAEGH